MARRTKEQLLAEFDRLYGCFEAMTWITWGDEDPDFWTSGLGRDITRREAMLADIDAGRCTASEALAGLRQALNDISLGLLDNPVRAAQWLARYSARTGRSFWDDAGHPQRFLARILKRGRIRDEAEFDLVNGVLGNLDQSLVDPAELAALNAMLGRFENRV